MKEIKIISWNVNGLKAIERKKALRWISKEDVDFLFLQESKLSTVDYDVSDLFSNKFKHSSNNFSRYTKGFSGTFSFSNYLPSFYSKVTEVDSDEDGRIIEFRYGKLCLFNVYFPNGKLNPERLKYKLRFYKEFLKYCIQLRKEEYSIIICGDFNTAHRELDLKPGKIYSNSGFTNLEREYFQKFLTEGFIDTFRYINGDVEMAYTLFPYRSKAREKNEGWRIDYILISEDLKKNLKDAFILKDILGSDHCPIGISIDLKSFL